MQANAKSELKEWIVHIYTLLFLEHIANAITDDNKHTKHCVLLDQTQKKVFYSGNGAETHGK